MLAGLMLFCLACTNNDDDIDDIDDIDGLTDDVGDDIGDRENSQKKDEITAYCIVIRNLEEIKTSKNLWG